MNDPRAASQFHPSQSADERMQRVCTDPGLAQLYFPAVLNWLPTDYKLAYDDAYFDYGSMMIYSSVKGLLADRQLVQTVALRETPMERRLPPGEDRSFEFADYGFFKGAQVDDSKKRTYSMDITRLAQMYPGGRKKMKLAKALVPSKQWTRVDLKAVDGGLHQTLGDLLIEPTYIDIVDKNLKPVETNSERIYKRLDSNYHTMTLWPDYVALRKESGVAKMSKSRKFELTVQKLKALLKKMMAKAARQMPGRTGNEVAGDRDDRPIID